ncbi:MAG: hypothetical protein F2791_01780 [Actinobacteria bacterium]|uniref:Unannotated protein n=1 Tax=freshwater metagenome TaxID=449393 RepID=A0A6J7CWV7_9ZZZZ|nr:hypothetical protein [Actinomycetota bacterium]
MPNLLKLSIAACTVLLLSGCSISPDSTNSTPASPEASEEAIVELTQEQITELITSLPEGKTLEALKAHYIAIDEAAKQLEPFEIEYTLGPTADPARVEKVVNQFSEKLKMYQFLGLESLNQDWVLASEKDYQWWVDFRSAQDPSFPVEMWNEEKNELGHCRLRADIFCGAGNTLNGKNYQNNVVGTAFTNRGIDYVSRHEAAHFYQAVFGYGGRCWMAEGQATFFETYLESSSRYRDEIISELRASKTGVAKLSESELLGLLTSDQICQGDSNIAYNLGMLGYEYLYMNFSFLDVHNLQVLSSTEGWDEAVSKVLGIEASELNAALAAYIFAETR